MGSYAELRIDGYNILSTKSEVDASVMTVFTEEDRLVRAPGDEDCGRAPGPWLHAQRPLGDLDSFDCAYVAPSRVVRDRLDVMGFTLARAKERYEVLRAARIAGLREQRRIEEETGEEFWAHRELAVLESLTFDEWLSVLGFVKSRGVHAVREKGGDPAFLPGYFLDASEATPSIRFVLSNEDYLMGWPSPDVRLFLRAALETCGDESPVEQDVSDLIGGGYYEPGDRIADDARALLTEDFPKNVPIIVLTEGSTDSHFLEQALRLLYPHLAPYFSFMDFSGMAVPGGAGPLAASVKAFAGARITNRIVALADNDTGGRDAVRQLKAVALPSNFRVLTYPPLAAASAWPTLGPTGTVTMDVNGLAGGIELYLGDDVLRREDGTRVPVQWRGLVAGLGQYQGELLEKAELQARFRRKLDLAAEDPSLLESLDWSGMIAILDALKRAFEDA
jgi:hypothetical protein